MPLTQLRGMITLIILMTSCSYCNRDISSSPHVRYSLVLEVLRGTIAQLRCHDASVQRLVDLQMPKLVEMLLHHWHP